jgi:hypothetical protein
LVLFTKTKSTFRIILWYSPQTWIFLNFSIFLSFQILPYYHVYFYEEFNFNTLPNPTSVLSFIPSNSTNI